MRKTSFVLIMLPLFFIACNSSEKKAEKKDKYEQTKETLEETEKKSPTRFLTVSGHDKKNILGQTVIKGTLSNNAKVSSYKDIDVELSFYSKTGTLLEKDHEIVYETLTPGNSTNFKTKYFAPKGTDSIAMKVVNAKPGS
jgi:hypothetical protein